VVENIVHFFSNPLHIAIVMEIVFVAFLALLVLLRIGARGRFIFLDNVAHERTGIVAPWKRYRKLGNSLFFWRLGFLVVCVMLFAAVTIPFLAVLGVGTWGNPSGFPMLKLIAIPAFLALVMPLALGCAFVALLMSDFVVPIMYRHELTAMAAWGRFLPLFRRQLAQFIGYGLFVLLLLIAVAAAVFSVGIATCCAGFVLLHLPYVGAVLLLPVTVTLRALGPEFLGQFGSDFAVLAEPAPPAVASVPAPSSPPPGAAG
jgi:hypothetical protein